MQLCSTRRSSDLRRVVTIGIRATAIFIVDCCQFGPSLIFRLKIELMACAGLVGGTTDQRCLFPDLI